MTHGYIYVLTYKGVAVAAARRRERLEMFKADMHYTREQQDACFITKVEILT